MTGDSTDDHGRGDSAPVTPSRKGHRKGSSAATASDAPQRRCIVSGEVQPKEKLLRFVVSPDGEIVVDLDQTLGGRGLWLSARRDMVETAVAKKAFVRAARRQVVVPADLAERIESFLTRRCLDALGLARRAGLVTGGFEKVRAVAREGRLALLLEASDGAEDGRRKLQALAPAVRMIDDLSSAQLAAALGRDHVIHVAVSVGPPAQRPLVGRLEYELDRLRAYRGSSPEGNRLDGGE